MSVSFDKNISDLLNTLFYSSNLGELVECASKILKNPISIYNTAFYCIALSSLDGIDDDMWQKGRIGENTKYEYASYLHDLEKKYWSNPVKYKYFYENVDTFGTHRRRMILLVFDSTVIGYMNVLQYHTEYEQITDEVYKLVVGAVTKAVAAERSFSNFSRLGSAEALLYDFLTEEFHSKSLFINRITNTVFEAESYYRLIAVDIENIRPGNSKIGDLKLSLVTLFTNAWSVLIEHYAVLLVRCGKATDLPAENMKALEDLLESYQLSAGVSDSFKDLYDIKKYFFQAKQAVEVFIKLSHKKGTAIFDDYKLWCCANLIQESYGDTLLCSTIKKMVEYDEANGSEYVRTLFCYLDSAKKLNVTAAKLHVHRNTVFYRLERIRELFGPGIAQGSDDYQNYFGCLLHYLHKAK